MLNAKCLHFIFRLCLCKVVLCLTHFHAQTYSDNHAFSFQHFMLGVMFEQNTHCISHFNILLCIEQNTLPPVVPDTNTTNPLHQAVVVIPSSSIHVSQCSSLIPIPPHPTLHHLPTHKRCNICTDPTIFRFDSVPDAPSPLSSDLCGREIYTVPRARSSAKENINNKRK